MDLISGDPYFLLKSGLYQDFDILQKDHKTDVLVLGGGVSGALAAYYLLKKGIPCTVIDKRKIGLGSTSASTSLLQYEIDVPLHALSRQIGHANAVAAYHLCAKAIDSIGAIAKEIGDTDFEYCNSVYFSHRAGKNKILCAEFEARRQAGFSVDFIEENEILDRYGMEAREAIVSQKAAKLDTYLFTQLLHLHNLKNGARIFENTNATEITANEAGITVKTEKGHTIKGKKIIYATGYEATEQISKSIVQLKSTFAFATERIPGISAHFKAIFWNTADPYLYVREAGDRLIIGGCDDKYNPAQREHLLAKKTLALEKEFSEFFPGIPIKPQFSWAGTFGSTKDGLPYIGLHPKKPNSYFALGFGGNGITFSALAGELIAKQIWEKVNAVPGIFGFDR